MLCQGAQEHYDTLSHSVVALFVRNILGVQIAFKELEQL